MLSCSFDIYAFGVITIFEHLVDEFICAGTSWHTGNRTLLFEHTDARDQMVNQVSAEAIVR